MLLWHEFCDFHDSVCHGLIHRIPHDIHFGYGLSSRPSSTYTVACQSAPGPAYLSEISTPPGKPMIGIKSSDTFFVWNGMLTQYQSRNQVDISWAHWQWRRGVESIPYGDAGIQIGHDQTPDYSHRAPGSLDCLFNSWYCPATRSLTLDRNGFIGMWLSSMTFTAAATTTEQNSVLSPSYLTQAFNHCSHRVFQTTNTLEQKLITLRTVIPVPLFNRHKFRLVEILEQRSRWTLPPRTP